ncbi:MAG: hypothetical protein OEZ23_04990, partial [Gammaproteobacteria bacterium]|nr:hypothetical protein [Gammaproteobacteria bacterium]
MRRLHQYLSCIVILGLLTLTACDSGDKRDSSRQSPSGKPGQVPGVEVPDDPVWAEYVARHTSGSISKRASIQIDFVRDLIEETQIGTDASAVVEISPDMTGKIEYSGRREITISPESALEPGAQYQVRILSSQIATFPASLGDYEFEFSVLPKDLEVRVLGMSSTEDTVMVTGQVVTSDYEDSAVIEQILKVQVDGQEISLDWDHGQNGTYHEWVARSIQRGTTEQTLQIIWDAEPLDLDRKGMHPLPIPPKGQFKVTGVSAVGGQGAESGATRYIQVRFSEPLDTNQNLKGLIQLGSAAFSTRIEGNILKIYPASAEPGAYTVTIEPGIKTSGGSTLKDRLQKDIYFEMQDPGVRFVGKGVILPDNPVLSVPFEAINVKSVKVTAFRIYEDNVGQFLQNNKLGGDAQLGRVGRYLWRKTIDLGQVQSNSWNRFALDATELLKSEPGALFRLTLSIDRSDSILECTEADKAKPIEESHIQDYDDINLSENSGWDYADYYYNENYWQDRRNPCKDEFYKNSGNASSHRNFMSSNLALMAKRGAEGSIRFVATDIRTATPVSGVSIDVRNFQDQSLGNLATDAEGFAQLNSDTAPFYVIANKGKEYAYLKVNAATALPLSHFDVGGDQVKQGVKGNIYGERGVWRPGDNIYLTFVLEDKNGVIPDDHPV